MIRIKVGRAAVVLFCLGLMAALALVGSGPALASDGSDYSTQGMILLAQGPIIPGRYAPGPANAPSDPMYLGPGENGHGPDGHGANPPGEDGAGSGGRLPGGHYQDYTVPDRDITGLTGGPAAPVSPSAPSASVGPPLGARSYRQFPEIRSGRLAPGNRSFRFNPDIRASRSLPPSPAQYQRYQQYNLGAVTDFFLLNPDIGGNPQQATTDIYIMNPNLRPSTE